MTTNWENHAGSEYSGKEYHQNSGLVFYLYRSYDPNLQRWLNRDPIEELGGINLYAYLGNNSIDRIDPYGFLTVYLWNYHGSLEWGHASISLDDGTHISWWPNNRPNGAPKIPIYSAPAFPNQKLADDIEFEGQQLPDWQIPIEGLDEDAIADWWSKFRKKNKWKTFSKNCSTVAGKALRKGGGDKGNWWTAHNIVWTPNDVRRFAQEINRELDKRWKKRLRELNIQHYFGPDDSGPFY